MCVCLCVCVCCAAFIVKKAEPIKGGGLDFEGEIRVKGVDRRLGKLSGEISPTGKVYITQAHGFEYNLPKKLSGYTPGKGGRGASQMFGPTGIRSIMRDIVKLGKGYGIKVTNFTGTRISGARELAGKSSYQTKVSAPVVQFGEVPASRLQSGSASLPPKSLSAAQLFSGRLTGPSLGSFRGGGGGGLPLRGGKIKINPTTQ